MEIEGVDRIVIGVKNMDKALEFFSDVLGVNMTEIKGALPDMSGLRLAVSLDTKLELISPVAAPVVDTNPPDPFTLARRLDQEGDGILYALVFKVRNLEHALANAERNGVRMIGKVIEVPREDQLGLSDFKEAVLAENDTFGIKMAFVEYRRDT